MNNCRACSAAIPITPGQTAATCEYCGCTYTVVAGTATAALSSAGTAVFSGGMSSGGTLGETPGGTTPPLRDAFSFYMEIEDVFPVTRGAVATGTIERGTINLQDEVRVLNAKFSTTVLGIEYSRATHRSATAGQNVGLLLRGGSKITLQRGDVIVK